MLSSTKKISSGTQAFTGYRSKGVTLPRGVEAGPSHCSTALGLVVAHNTSGAIRKLEHNNNKQERKQGLSVSPGKEIRASESLVLVLWAGAECPLLPFTSAQQVRMGACTNTHHYTELVPGSCCLELLPFNFFLTSVLVAAWKSKRGGRDMMPTEIVQFNGGNNLSNSQY